MIVSLNKGYVICLTYFFSIGVIANLNAQFCDTLTQGLNITHFREHGRYNFTLDSCQFSVTLDKAIGSLGIEPPVSYEPKYVLLDFGPSLLWFYYGHKDDIPKSTDNLLTWLDLTLFIKKITQYHEIHQKSFILDTQLKGRYQVNKYLGFYKNNKILQHKTQYHYHYEQFIEVLKMVGLLKDFEYLIELRFEVVVIDEDPINVKYTDNITFVRPLSTLNENQIFNWIDAMTSRLTLSLE